MSKPVSASMDDTSKTETMNLEPVVRGGSAAASPSEKFATICDLAPVGLITLTERGRVIEANAAAAAMLGERPDAIEGRTFQRFLAGSEKKHFLAHLRKVFRSESPVPCDIEMCSQTGLQRRVYLLSVAVSRGRRDKLCLMAFIDAAQAGDGILQLHQHVLNSMDEGVVMMSRRDGTIIQANVRFEQALGFAPGELKGKPIAVIRPADRESRQQRRRMMAHLLTHCHWEGELVNVGKTGDRLWFHAKVSTLRHPDFGDVYLSVERNITHEKEIQARLDAQDLQLHAVLDAMPANVAILDHTGNVIAINRGWSRFAAENGADATAAAGIGINYLDVCRAAEQRGDASAGAAAEGIEPVLSGQHNQFSMEYPCGTSDKARWFAMSVTPLGTPRPHGAIVLHFDITARRQMEAELCRQREALALESRLHSLSELASGITHELTQPLTAITYYCDALQATQEDPESPGDIAAGLIERIKSQTLRATTVVSHLRDFMRKLTPELTVVSVESLLRDTVGLADNLARENGVRLRLFVPDALPSVVGDAIQLKQVLMHLLRNAIEATGSTVARERSVTISAGCDPGWVRISVKDNGPGMEKTWVRGIFDIMKMSTPHRLGFGLGISQSIVKAHGGRLWLDTTCEQGTCMHFTIPAAGEKHDP